MTAPDIETVKLVLASADHVSALADKVAGFAISSYLLLTFACLKDIGKWVTAKWRWFLWCSLGGGVVYSLAVTGLYCIESEIRDFVVPDSVVAAANARTGHWLVAARIAGIALFTLVAMLAVVGAKNKPAATSRYRLPSRLRSQGRR